MLLRGSSHGPAILTLAAAFAMGIMLVGGCPQQQVPTPPSSQNDGDDETPGTDNNQGGQDRPIPPPVIEPEEPTGGDEGGEEPGQGGQGGGTTTTGWSVRFTSPLTLAAVRPGTPVDVAFKLSDVQGVVSQMELVLARDADGNGQPDGGPVSSKPIKVTVGSNSLAYDSAETTALLSNGFGQFLIGVRVTTKAGAKQTFYAPGGLIVDAVPPTVTWVSPTDDAVTGPAYWTVRLQTNDNSKHTVQVLLDTDTDPNNGYAGILVESTEVAAGGAVREFTRPLSISSGTYYYYVVVSDGIDPPVTLYAPNLQQGGLLRVMLTRRLIGTFDLNKLDPFSPQYDNYGSKSKGAIFQGFNFNDLAGSSMVAVPDTNGDGVGEVLVGARFGKPHTTGLAGVGFGEAYLFYGSPSRFRNTFDVNSIAGGSVPGLIFPGIRAPLLTSWTEGLADITVVPDMDGDQKPELVFAFPRVESVSLNNTSWRQPVRPDTYGMGALEYDAYDYTAGQWKINEAQFTRGGVVIVSSQDNMLKDPGRLNRKGDRVLDLAEVGQMFTQMGRARYVLRVAQAVVEYKETMCGDPPAATPYEEWTVWWDVLFENQGPGGFDNHFTDVRFGRLTNPNQPSSYTSDPYQPPLANIRSLAYNLSYLNGLVGPNEDPCLPGNCVRRNKWLVWGACPTPFPTVYGPSLLCGNPSWHASFNGQESGQAIWTGFYPTGPETGTVAPLDGQMVGARILGERREDRFGASVGADGRWLYVAAPQRSVTIVDENNQSYSLTQCGMVYGIRTQAYLDNIPITRTQLWIEPGTRTIPPAEPNGQPTIVPLAFPYIDAQFPDRQDWLMPVPHQYIIGTVGSTRGRDIYWSGSGGIPLSNDPDERRADYSFTGDGCITNVRIPVIGGMPADTIGSSFSWRYYNPGRSGYYMSSWNLVSVVGPHAGAKIGVVRGLGDVNRDGHPDFVVGSGEVRERFSNPLSPSGNKVGAVFIVYGRPFGVELDYMLYTMVLAPNDPERVRGVVLRGTSASEQLGRVFDNAGDFDRNGATDVVVGAEGFDSNRGRVVVVLGSSTLSSPEGGWTPSDVVAAGRGIIFRGAAVGDRAGANVAGAGDVDGDGYADILIAAPGADGGRGAVYLVYGSRDLAGREVSLADIGKISLPGVKFTGRAIGDQLGGGSLTYGDGDPNNPNGNTFLNPNGHVATVSSRGVAALGDIDGDGLADLAMSAVFANPSQRDNAGEVYILYGVGD